MDILGLCRLTLSFVNGQPSMQSKRAKGDKKEKGAKKDEGNQEKRTRGTDKPERNKILAVIQADIERFESVHVGRCQDVSDSITEPFAGTC